MAKPLKKSPPKGGRSARRPVSKAASKAKVASKPAKPAKSAKPAPKLAAKPAPKVVEKAVEKKTRQQSELEAKLLHLISEEMAIEEAELTPDAVFRQDLNLDEIDVAELLMQAEAAFNVHPFTETDWDACTTVGEFVQLVTRRVEAKRGRKNGKS